MEGYDNDRPESEFEGQVYQPTDEERRYSAELMALLEQELSFDARRLRISVRQGGIWAQGSVASHELRQRIEEILTERANGRVVQVFLSVQAGD
jgi:hypothetical protein